MLGFFLNVMRCGVFVVVFTTIFIFLVFVK